jgi:hypothetical protein
MRKIRTRELRAMTIVAAATLLTGSATAQSTGDIPTDDYKAIFDKGWFVGPVRSYETAEEAYIYGRQLQGDVRIRDRPPG